MILHPNICSVNIKIERLFVFLFDIIILFIYESYFQDSLVGSRKSKTSCIIPFLVIFSGD